MTAITATTPHRRRSSPLVAQFSARDCVTPPCRDHAPPRLSRAFTALAPYNIAQRHARTRVKWAGWCSPPGQPAPVARRGKSVFASPAQLVVPRRHAARDGGWQFPRWRGLWKNLISLILSGSVTMMRRESPVGGRVSRKFEVRRMRKHSWRLSSRSRRRTRDPRRSLARHFDVGNRSAV
jgi:hypothetical protein